jgi:hypothetical protein
MRLTRRGRGQVRTEEARCEALRGELRALQAQLSEAGLAHERDLKALLLALTGTSPPPSAPPAAPPRRFPARHAAPRRPCVLSFAEGRRGGG